MKKFILLICLASSIIFNNSFSWDTTAAKYLPLQVGNVWVYSSGYSSMFGNGTSFERYRITGTQFFSGKVYYIFEHTHVQISGTYGCSSRLFSGDNAVRIDSVSMNISKYASCGTSSEGMVDSLASGFGDSSATCFNLSGSKTVLSDTADYCIFNTFYNAKKFTTININGGNDQTYLEGIGLARYYFSVSNEVCSHDLKGCIINGIAYGDTSIISGVNQLSSEVPADFHLSQNYPNPFNPATRFVFRIADFGLVRLTVCDVLGKEILDLVNQELSPGTYEVDFDGSNLPSGVYYYRIVAEEFVQTKKMVLIK